METNCITPIKNGIYNCNDLIAFLDAVNQKSSLQPWQDEKGVINLMNDINLQGKEMPYTYSFKNTFDGKNHTIYSIKPVGENEPANCIFTYLEESGIVKNLKVIRDISSKTSYSGIVSANCGLIQNCSLKGDTKGGIVSVNYDSGIIIGCTYEGNISREEYDCAGIARKNFGTISNCHNETLISSGKYPIERIAYRNSGKLLDCTWKDSEKDAIDEGYTHRIKGIVGV